MSHLYKSLKSRDELYDVATHIIGAHLLNGLDISGSVNLLLSGGSTPGPVYKNLSNMALDWRRVNVGLVDERWVDEDDPGSNAALIRRTLLQNKASGANFVPMKTRETRAADGQANVEASYAGLVTNNSLAVLGMGTDGHVCSWFPRSVGLQQAVDPNNTHNVQAIQARKSKVTGEYLERMTLTLSALNRCQSVLLLMTGEEKQDVFKRGFESAGFDLPVSHLFQKGDPSHLTVLHAA